MKSIIWNIFSYSIYFILLGLLSMNSVAVKTFIAILAFHFYLFGLIVLLYWQLDSWLKTSKKLFLIFWGMIVLLFMVNFGYNIYVSLTFIHLVGLVFLILLGNCLLIYLRKKSISNKIIQILVNRNYGYMIFRIISFKIIVFFLIFSGIAFSFMDVSWAETVNNTFITAGSSVGLKPATTTAILGGIGVIALSFGLGIICTHMYYYSKPQPKDNVEVDKLNLNFTEIQNRLDSITGQIEEMETKMISPEEDFLILKLNLESINNSLNNLQTLPLSESDLANKEIIEENFSMISNQLASIENTIHENFNNFIKTGEISTYLKGNQTLISIKTELIEILIKLKEGPVDLHTSWGYHLFDTHFVKHDPILNTFRKKRYWDDTDIVYTSTKHSVVKQNYMFNYNSYFKVKETTNGYHLTRIPVARDAHSSVELMTNFKFNGIPVEYIAQQLITYINGTLIGSISMEGLLNLLKSLNLPEPEANLKPGEKAIKMLQEFIAIFSPTEKK